MSPTRCLRFLLLASLLAATAAWAQAPDWKKIRVGVEGNYPLFSKS